MTRKILPFIAALLIVFSFFLLLHPQLLQLNNLPPIQGVATQSSFSMGITILAAGQHEQLNNIVPANGTVYGTNSVGTVVENISGLTPGWTFNITLHNISTFPVDWTESPPSTSVATSNRFGFLDIRVNDSTSGGAYTLYFNVPQSSLGSVSPSQVRLFIYESDWTELTTIVINADNDPAEFSAVTSHFSKFMIAEKGSSQVGGGTGGGGGGEGAGGGGGGAGELAEQLNLGFSISPELMEASLAPGEESVQYLLIQNRDARAQFAVSVSGSLSKFAVVSDRSFTLLPGEERLVKISFYISEDLKPGVYTGEIKVSSATEKNSFSDATLVALDIKGTDSLFDFIVRLLPKYKAVLPNSRVVSSISFANIGAPESPTDVQLMLKVVDYQKKVIVESVSEVVGIKGEDTIVRELQLPATIAPGEYLVLGEMIYINNNNNITLYSYDTFKVAEIVSPEVQVPGVWSGLSGGIWNAAVMIMLGVVFVISLGGIILLVMFMHRHTPLKHRRTVAGSRSRTTPKKKSFFSAVPSMTERSPSVGASSTSSEKSKSSVERSLPDKELERGEVVMLDKLKGTWSDLKDSFLKK